MTSPKNSTAAASDAVSPPTAPEAVAVAPKPTSAPVETVSVDTCADCDDTNIAGCTDGVSSTKRCYCAMHLPANVAANTDR